MNATIRVAAIFTAALSASALVSQVDKPQSQRYPQFENDAVKVWRTVVQPHQPLAMHHHDHPRVIVALTDGTMNSVTPDGAIEPHPWQAGHAYWLPAMAPGTLHGDANAGEKPIEVMVIELQKER